MIDLFFVSSYACVRLKAFVCIYIYVGVCVCHRFISFIIDQCCVVYILTCQCVCVHILHLCLSVLFVCVCLCVCMSCLLLFCCCCCCVCLCVSVCLCTLRGRSSAQGDSFSGGCQGMVIYHPSGDHRGLGALPTPGPGFSHGEGHP